MDPAALTAVMKLNGVQPDFPSTGSLALKPWITNDQGLALPRDIALPVVEAPQPYNEQIAVLSEQVGAVIARLEPRGMARALFATALAQALVPVIALAVWKPRSRPVCWRCWP